MSKKGQLNDTNSKNILIEDDEESVYRPLNNIEDDPVYFDDDLTEIETIKSDSDTVYNDDPDELLLNNNILDDDELRINDQIPLQVTININTNAAIKELSISDQVKKIPELMKDHYLSLRKNGW